MKVFIVIGDDRESEPDGWSGDQWIVGVFSSSEKAVEAEKNDKDRYKRSGINPQFRGELVYFTLEIELDRPSYRIL